MELEHYIGAFSKAMRRLVDPKTANTLIAHTATWIHYYRFLDIVTTRWIAVGEELSQETRAFSQLFSRPSAGPVTPEQSKQLEKLERLNTLTHLEVESFYIFAKILLDRVADTFSYYFQIPPNKFGSSHSHLCVRFDRVCKEKGLVDETGELGSLMNALKKRVVDYRTEDIEHTQQLRGWAGTLMNPGEGARTTPNFLFAVEGAGQKTTRPKQSENLKELGGLLADYLILSLNFFIMNAAKSILQSRLSVPFPKP